jgi:hypothetical protein
MIDAGNSQCCGSAFVERTPSGPGNRTSSTCCVDCLASLRIRCKNLLTIMLQDSEPQLRRPHSIRGSPHAHPVFKKMDVNVASSPSASR